jgi:hypothetical protein
VALNKALVPLSFSQGIDTKQDKKQLVIGKLRKAQNIVFDTLDQFSKRNGYNLIQLRTAANAVIGDVDSLTKFNNELCLFADSQLFSFSDATQRLESRGTIYSAVASITPVLNNNYNHDSIDMIVTENLKCTVYHNAILDDVRYSVQDLTTGSLLVSNDVVDTASQRIMVANIQNFVYLIYTKGTGLFYKRINIINPAVLGPAVSLANNVDTAAPTLDVIPAGNKLVIAYNSSVGGAKVRIFDIESDGTAGSAIGLAGSNASSALSLTLDAQNRIMVAIASPTAVSYAVVAYTIVAPLLSLTLVETISNAKAVDICQTGTTYCIRYEIGAADPTNHYVKQATLTLGGTVGTPEVFLRSVGLATKHFSVNNSTYIAVSFASQLQNTIFIVDNDGTVVIKLQPGTSGGHLTTGALSKVSTDGLTAELLAQTKGRNVSENGTFYSLLGINSIKLNFSPTDSHQNAMLGQNLHIAGGILQMYDGDTVVEHGFNVFPEQLVAEVPDTTPGSVAPGNYGYQAIYSWTDNAGQQHRSAPSKVLEVNVAASSAPTGTAATDASIVLTSLLNGQYRNTNTFTIVVAAPAANPTSTVLATTSGTSAATVLTITPNDGTNNSLVPVTLTTAEIVSVINTGLVVNKTVTVTDTNKLLFDISATGGSTVNAVAGSYAATLAGGYGVAPSGTLSTTTPVVVYSRTVGPSKNDVKFTLQVAPAAANPTNTILAVYTGTATNITLTITPNNGTNNAAVPVNLTTAELAQLLSIKTVPGKFVTVTDASLLSPDLRATGGGAANLADGGEGDGLAAGLSGGLLITSQKIKVPTLRLTEKQNVSIELYRTEASGSVFYKVSSINTPTFNDKTVDYVTISDTIADADLISRESLYTTGGVLENTGAPSCSIVAVHTASNRIFVVGEQPNVLKYSKIQTPGSPVEFNDALERSIDPIGGAITAAASMDEKLIIFESDAILYISGSGPNNLGLQDNFTEPERISIDVGCIEPRSVVLSPNGLMFKSRKGIYLLTRGLSLEYIGAPVQEYNDLTITSAKIVGELNQIRFTTLTGSCLVYNYYVAQWATYENHAAISAEVLGNDYYYLRSNEELFKENRSTFSDNGVPIKMLAETGWLSFSQLQGFMRVYKLLILGEYKSPHKLRIRVGYDFNEAWVQEEIIDTSDFIDNTPYGGYSINTSGTVYGDPVGQPYGGDGNVYQARIDFERQKCQSIKISIEDVQAEAGEGLSLSTMTLQVGSKQGTNKLPVTNQYGTE